MGFQMPNGGTLEIAAEYEAEIPVTAVSNSNPAVATGIHDLEDGAVIAISSGWTRLNDRAARVTAVEADQFAFDGIDTSNVQAYPAGSGIGSVRAVKSFREISQITELNASGGDQQFYSFGFLADDDDRQIPTTKNPITLAITVADDPSLPYVAVCEAADEDKKVRVLRLNLPGGLIMLYSGYVSITSTPTLARNNLMTRVISVALAGRPMRYKTLIEQTT